MKTAAKSFPASSMVCDSGACYTSHYDLFTVGAGYLDVWDALNNSDLAAGGTGTAASPTAVFDLSTGSVYVQSTALGGVSSVWGSSAVWGSSTVWGSTATTTTESTAITIAGEN